MQENHRLVKYCERQYSPKESAFLKLGSVMEYRHTANSEIIDVEEGAFDFLIRFSNEVVVSRNALNQILFNSVAFADTNSSNLNFGANIFRGISLDGYGIAGSVKIDISRLEIREVRDSEGKFGARGQIGVHFQPSNCFMFCMSQEQGLDRSPFSKYNSSWSLPLRNADAFAETIRSYVEQSIDAQRMSHRLLGAFTVERSDPNDPQTVDIARGTAKQVFSKDMIEVHSHHRNVYYGSKVFQISNGQELEDLDWSDLLKSAMFIKGPQFAHENEYRFLFYPVNNSVNSHAMLKFPDFLDIAYMVPFDLVEKYISSD